MTTFQGLESIVQEDVPLGPMTTFGVGGPAEYFVRPRSEDELRDVLVRAASTKVPPALRVPAARGTAAAVVLAIPAVPTSAL